MKMQGMQVALLALCTLTVGAIPALAQDPGAPPPPVGQRDPGRMEARQVGMLTKRLKLTPDQVTQVQGIEDAQQQQMEAIRNDSSLAPRDRREKMMALRQDTQGKIRAVLTDEQKPQYDQMMAQQQERMAERRGRGGAGAPPQGQEPPPPPPQN